jgi:hypothetical protein
MVHAEDYPAEPRDGLAKHFILLGVRFGEEPVKDHDPSAGRAEDIEQSGMHAARPPAKSRETRALAAGHLGHTTFIRGHDHDVCPVRGRPPHPEPGVDQARIQTGQLRLPTNHCCTNEAGQQQAH